MTKANRVWNRACAETPGNGAGDRALHALIRVHSVVMNGGVRHCLDVLTREQIQAGVQGYRYFGLDAIGQIFQKSLALAGDESGEAEEGLDQEYHRHVPDDGELVRRFEDHFWRYPEEFESLPESSPQN